MSRPKKFHDAAFIAAHKHGDSNNAIAAVLGVSVQTVYAYQRRLGLIPKKERQTARSLDIYNAFTGKTTIRDLAIEFEMVPNSVRYHLDRAIVLVFRDAAKRPIYPPPRKVSDIRIIHELQQKPSLFDDPAELARRTGMSEERVQGYLEFAFNHLAQAEPKKGKRAAR